MKSLLIALLLMLPVGLFAKEKKGVKEKVIPSEYVAKVKLKTKSQSTYYGLSEKKVTTVKVKGSGTLEIRLRVRLIDTCKTSKPFYLKYELDNKKTKLIKVNGKKISSKTTYVSDLNGHPTKAATVKIEIPEGQHTIKFYKAETSQKIHAHFSYKKKEDATWEAMQSKKALDAVKIKYLNKNHEVKNYSRISSINKFEFESDGVQSVKIIVKAELKNTIATNSPLILQFEEDSKMKKTYKIDGKISSLTEYVEEKKLIPGNSNVIYLSTSEGKHTYKVSIKEAQSTAIVLIYVKKVKKEEKKKV